MSAPKVLVIGTGFGATVHVPALRRGGFDVVGLLGRDPERTARRAKQVDTTPFLDLDTALGLDGLAAVSVATPPATHALIVRAACDRGLHVLCEKPLAVDRFEAREMQRAAANASVVGLVGHEFRWAPEVACVARALADGLIGEPRLASIAMHLPLHADDASPAKSWWFDPTEGGGNLGAHGSHLVDNLHVWFGAVGSVNAHLDLVSRRPPESADDSFSALLAMRSGVRVVVQHTVAAWGPRSEQTRIVGSDGTLWLDGQTLWLADREGHRVVEVPRDLDVAPPAEPSVDMRSRLLQLIDIFEPMARSFRAHVDGLESNSGDRRHNPQPATFGDGVATMAVLDAMRESSARDGALAVVEY